MHKANVVCAIVLSFFVLTFLVYSRSLNNKFVRWDDGLLIYENPIVREISPWSIRAAFTTYDPELYIPLTLLSYQFDYLIGGTDPFIYHLGNLILHTLNALLVTWLVHVILSGVEGWRGRREKTLIALFSGLLFAVHPLHTEAVVWASARKDVLAAFFFLASLVAYLRACVGAPRAAGRPYVLSLMFFLLGLLSKVVVITLPLVLLLIDDAQGRKIRKDAVVEKLPYLGLSLLFGAVAIGGKTRVLESATLFETALMAGKSTVFYLQKLFVPTGLSVLYPFRGDIRLASPGFFVPLVLVLLLVGFSFSVRRFTRELFFGVAFFLIALSPTFVNFAKGGDMDLYFASDRYAYLPSIGIFFLVAIGLSALFRRFGKQGIGAMVVAMAVVTLIFSVLSFKQSRVWADSETLFRNVLAHYPVSHVARNNLGNAYRIEGRDDEAIGEFKAAISLRDHPRPHSNLGAVYRKKGMIAEAFQEYRKAIELDPENPEPHFGLGLVYAQQGDVARALNSYNRALELDPSYAEVYNNIGALRMAAGNVDEAIAQYRAAVAADRFFVQAYYNLGIALSKRGNVDEAIGSYERAIELRPDFVAARINLGILYYNIGRVGDAENQFRAVLKLDPGNAAARAALKQMAAP